MSIARMKNPAMDAAADDAIKNGKGNENMSIKLEPCRGRGLK
jgi:hypothetical protein